MQKKKKISILDVSKMLRWQMRHKTFSFKHKLSKRQRTRGAVLRKVLKESY